MEINHLYKGMLIDCHHGISEVLIVDSVTRSVLVKNTKTHHQEALGLDEVFDEPQLHPGCDKYY
ncbi:hypothetical protein RJD38_08810 [Vibrio scophthalmi]|uniref:Uncharacterized protein n=2 Tax=Vibrio scophthalmi TaxID=45658 RepID=F9RJB6_9VIBR|nr:hypothetical protein [Vibrio scophthalmi]ANU37459.1 hypothetical protein VSVS05_02364 [Vibrio scophthalmi]EGU41044.1 hypothetical protein VIS19158_04336 [Vibrio scophthalmi LMG 19158]